MTPPFEDFFSFDAGVVSAGSDAEEVGVAVGVPVPVPVPVRDDEDDVVVLIVVGIDVELAWLVVDDGVTPIVVSACGVPINKRQPWRDSLNTCIKVNVSRTRKENHGVLVVTGILSLL